jgi:hypothetical protein
MRTTSVELAHGKFLKYSAQTNVTENDDVIQTFCGESLIWQAQAGFLGEAS